MAPSLSAILPQANGDGVLHIHRLVALAAGAGVLLVVWRLALVVYRLTLHPLAKFPGPKLYAATKLPHVWKCDVTGTFVRESKVLHEKYGPIVRIGPNHLAVDGSIGWPQIYQHRPGKPEWPKVRGFFFEGDSRSLIGADKENHRRLRRQLGHAFSTDSMLEQEPIVLQYVDLFISQLSKKAAAGEVFDIIPWFNFLTFDIIGDLTFADSFHNLDGGKYHPWVLGIFQGIRGGGLRRAIMEYPLLGPFFRFGGEKAANLEKEAENRRLANEKAMLRKEQGESPNGRQDFMTYMLKKTRDGNPGFDDIDILTNSPVIVTAGSETTATTMSGLTFYLGQKKYRHVYDTLVKEIRSSFKSESEINMLSTARLPYLFAVLEEILRMYPAAAQMPARVSPGTELEGQYIPEGTKATIFQYATYRNPANFHDPDNLHPERWLPATHELYNPVFANDNKASFHPFSYGTRDCLGKNLAYSELRIVTARLLFRFDYELDAGQEDWADSHMVILVWEKGPLRVKLTERKLVPVE